MAGTFQGRLRKKTTTKDFIGREAELALFKSLLEQHEPEYLILLVHGIGGVGKTWLLNQWHAWTREKGLPTARVNDEQTSVEQILKKFRDDLTGQGFTFDQFDKSYQKFRQLKSEAEKALIQWEEQREEGAAKMAGRMTGKSVAVLAKLFAPSREALEFVGGSEKVEQIFAEGFGYLRKKFTSKEDLEFLENPLLRLTRSFAADLNQVCRKKRVALFLDTYEYLAPFSDAWFCRTFLAEELSDQIMFVFAGRETFSSCWLDYQPLARQIPLDVFTDEEAHTYLTARGVTDPRAVTEILRTSGKLPVYLAMLTTQAAGFADAPRDPTETVVERFLQWIPKGESEKRRAVMYCAFPRYFHRDLLQALLNTSSTETARALFDWLRGQPFISHSRHNWGYHELVRQQILQYKQQESPQEFKEVHAKALAYYRQHPEDETMGEELYHLLNIDAEQGIAFGLAGIFQAWVEGKSLQEWNSRVKEVIRQVEKERNGETPYSSIWEEHLKQILQQTPDSEGILTQLGSNETFSSSARTGAYVTLGNRLSDQHRVEEAEQAYHKAIELNPEYADAYNNLGLLLADQHRIEEAEQAYRKAIELTPEYATAYNNLGLLLKNQPRIEKAEQAYRKAITLNPEYAPAYNNLGILLADQHRVKEAEQAYRKAIELTPELAEAHNNLGLLLSDQHRLEEAEQAYGKAITLNPEYAPAYNNLGNLRTEQHRVEEAEQAYRKAIELNPKFAEAYYNLGILRTEQHRVEEAEEAYRKVIKLNPKFAEAYYNLGILLQNQHRVEEAEEAYRKAIELNPEYAIAYNNLGGLLSNQHRVEEAEQVYRKAIELNPEYASAYGSLGWMFYEMGEWEKSITASRQALMLDCSKTWIQFNLAVALLCQGNVEDANKEYQKGMDMADSEDLDAAITDLQDALGKYPDLPGSRELLTELQQHKEHLSGVGAD